jgi:hypothetical protein
MQTEAMPLSVFQRRVALAMLLAAAAGCAPEARLPPRAPVPAAARAEADVVAAARPGVVVIVNRRPDRTVVYGAGIVLDARGHVLTSLHVVANAQSLGAVFHDTKRATYTREDGGLGRYLFENEKDIRPGALERGDAVLDLAIVKIDADTSGIPLLPLRTEPVRQGERVFALGHPREALWSVSSGVVSSVDSSEIRTDATIDHRHAGGPFIDTAGRIVGLQAVAFARPIALAKDLIERTRSAATLDFSTPETAFATCTRAWEVASEALAACFDEVSAVRASKEMRARMVASIGPELEELRRRPGGESIRRVVRSMLDADPSKEASFQRQILVSTARATSLEDVLRGNVTALARRTGQDTRGLLERLDTMTTSGAWKSVVDSERPYAPSLDRRRLARTGMKLDTMNPLARRELRRLGLRLDRVARVGDRAWLVVRGCNLDATEYSYSELWMRRGDQWLPVSAPLWDDLATRPDGFPPTLDDFESAVANQIDTTRRMFVTPAGIPASIPASRR